jgi:hypothetical protein
MGRRVPFTLRFAPEAVEHLDAVDVKYYGLLRRAIREQLRFDSTVETRNRKPLNDPAPFDACWELRCGPDNRFRVFYNVNEASHEVEILAIGVKDRSRLFIGGREYKT